MGGESIFRVRRDEYPWGSEHYLAHGAMMPADALTILDGYGHLPEVEAPEIVNPMLRKFFAS